MPKYCKGVIYILNIEAETPSKTKVVRIKHIIKCMKFTLAGISDTYRIKLKKTLWTKCIKLFKGHSVKDLFSQCRFVHKMNWLSLSCHVEIHWKKKQPVTEGKIIFAPLTRPVWNKFRFSPLELSLGDWIKLGLNFYLICNAIRF